MDRSIGKPTAKRKAIDYDIDTNFDAFAWMANAFYWIANKIGLLLVNIFKASIVFAGFVIVWFAFVMLGGSNDPVTFPLVALAAILVTVVIKAIVMYK